MSKEDIDKYVTSNPVVVFSKSYCPYCVKVKELLQSINVSNMKVIELDQSDDGPKLQQVLGTITGQTTVPSVWVGGKFIGGCDDTTKLHKQGKLVPALTEAKAL